MSPSRPFENKRVVIVHGYMASPTDHWFPTLTQSLEVEGARVDVVSLPESNAPRAQAWAATLQDVVPHVDENTFIIGHSLGCVTTLRHLQSLPAGSRIGGLVLVSGFDCTLDNIPELAEFTPTPSRTTRSVVAPRTSCRSSRTTMTSSIRSTRTISPNRWAATSRS
ncbi:MAG: putative hydrolase YdeN [Luteibacter sp.]|uniref:RBBP9/YdeN family alpha/beta hydrolase n=1 Tax=Luteibacter sp. TaxID=1886636 RepID=UPI0013849DB1|nr:alpha/beta fold hydrolase [Luteibacter sp.]KAF1006166.1 MAG: putative hydrolase YdeN [Luteibacter sp.]